MKFYLPTKIFFEDNYIQSIDEIKRLGDKFLIITGKSSKINKSLDELLKILNKLNKKYEIFDETLENPPKEMINNIIERYGKNWDVIVGLGGGSPMDTAKAVAVLCKNNISVEELYDSNKYNSAAKILCIPTTSGTGSEVTQYSVLTINNVKKGFKHDVIFPDVAILEPKYTLTLNKELTVSTALDALSHAIEAFLSLRANSFSDLYALKAIEIISLNLNNLVKDLGNYELRKKIMLASLYAGISIGITGTTIAHSLGYSLTTEKGIKHGLATAVFLPFEIEHSNSSKANKIKEILGDPLEFLKSLNILIKFSVNEREIEAWSQRVLNSSHVKVTPGNYDFSKIKETYKWLLEKSGLYGGNK
ncbi:alcohol dehydrogenase [Thermosipho melanesiensis]|uniref:Iron-containing alcohol dehydrogenase n=2 Tax=Thermosipho melanesiensis TaxID=46541 RepID=A6LP70_THEM4|nr:iron-containing alcohol dehydrogenase family protein [Thermosipho melanesiensis]ABR31721.1 iron-containing alcohol dehydrogenase [Thermosipho melanesiensis BI429]APT74743.1 alcohol dehydrogenase [Thermosipho melanesiensis]OOC35245.1 alcohol dehydrogenase [Thermosipho melanesiensis]OOC35455.1 alcohol dehydrogenase [Thermosipho melanesiensis]OOC36707.1 alcohol dehydrogenase [Thermosipho melanesiensis]